MRAIVPLEAFPPEHGTTKSVSENSSCGSLPCRPAKHGTVDHRGQSLSLLELAAWPIEDRATPHVGWNVDEESVWADPSLDQSLYCESSTDPVDLLVWFNARALADVESVSPGSNRISASTRLRFVMIPSFLIREIPVANLTITADESIPS